MNIPSDHNLKLLDYTTWRSRQDIKSAERCHDILFLIAITMNSQYTTFKPHGKAPRPLSGWSGPWSTLKLLHEIEYFQYKKLGRRAATAPKDIYGARAISRGSFFITILGIFVLSTIVFLGHILALLFPCSSPRRCCCTLQRPVGSSNRHRGDCRGSKPASKLELRNKRNRLRFRLCDWHCSRQSDPYVIAKHVNVNPFELLMTRS